MIQKRNLHRMFVAALGALALSAGVAHAQGGGEGSKGGGGGDVISDLSRVRWFRFHRGEAERPLLYCSEMDPKFGVDLAQANALIESTFYQWQRYQTDRGLTALSVFRTPSRIQRIAKCDGTQDLHFYFGFMMPQMTSARSRYENPHSFSAVDSFFASERMWRKGDLWFAPPGSVPLPRPYEKESFPNWAGDPLQLQTALLHEWGHVLGCQHVAGTVMREDVWTVMIDPVPEIAALRGKIDQDRELYRDLFDSPVRVQGNLRFENGLSPEQQGAAATLLSKLGFVKGPMRVGFAFTPEGESLDLTFVQGNKVRHFVLPHFQISGFNQHGEVFSGTAINGGTFCESATISGTASFPDHSRVLFQIEYNSEFGDEPFQLFAVVDGFRILVGSFSDTAKL